MNRLVRYFSKIKPPQNPTMAESFGTKIEKKDLEKFMNPMGFLNEKDMKDYNNQDVKQNKKTQEKQAEKDSDSEFGFKIKGPEPTRFGDWERKGRCTDF